MGWATTKELSLFPAAIDLDALEDSEAKRLRTWFVAHVNIKPHKGYRRKRRRQVKSDDGIEQLMLFDLDDWMVTPDEVAADGLGDV